MTDEVRSLNLKPLKALGAYGAVAIENFFTENMDVYVDFPLTAFATAREARQQIRKILHAQDVRGDVAVKVAGFFRNQKRREIWRAKLELYR